jgi:hypothetical protein
MDKLGMVRLDNPKLGKGKKLCKVKLCKAKLGKAKLGKAKIC